MKKLVVLSLLLIVSPMFAVNADARVVALRHPAILCCGGSGGWEVRDVNADGSYTYINLCDGGGICT